MGELKEVFLAFCDATKKGSTTATDKTLKKICVDAKLLHGSLNQNAVDIEFRKYIGNAKKDIDFPDFVKFVDGNFGKAYADAHKSADQAHAAEEIKKKIIGASPKSHGATKASGDDATKRLTDVKGYTGAHKERFDADTGKGKGIEGREEVVDKKAAEGYVGGYKEMDSYDKKH